MGARGLLSLLLFAMGVDSTVGRACSVPGTAGQVPWGCTRAVLAVASNPGGCCSACEGALWCSRWWFIEPGKRCALYADCVGVANFGVAGHTTGTRRANPMCNRTDPLWQQPLTADVSVLAGGLKPSPLPSACERLDPKAVITPRKDPNCGGPFPEGCAA
eukprot:Hpha_TRINITY_DN23139_c0_g1::TRINITY_DN23139_c0_g1_i1::g.29478::m.29478